MATKQAKTVKLAPRIKAAAQRICEFVRGAIQGKTVADQAKGSLSSGVAAEFMTLRGECASVESFRDECKRILGEGSNKKGAIVGLVWETLAMDADDPNKRVVSTMLSRARKVSVWLEKPANFAKFKAQALTLDGAYKLAKGPIAKRKAHPETAASEPQDMEALIAAFGVPATCAVLAKLLAVEKATKTQAQAIEAIGKQLAA